LSVKTNVGYSIVADFVVQAETIEQISEALRVLSDWNPEWKPPYFMTDYSDAVVGTIESTFPGCRVHLCDFHREQAWEQWVKDRKHGLSPVDGEVLFELLRKCATASPAVGVPAQQKPNCCFSKQLGYCSCVTILPVLIERILPICY